MGHRLHLAGCSQNSFYLSHVRLARASPEISSQSVLAVFRFTWPTGWTGLPQITPWDKSLFPSKAPAGNQMDRCLLAESTSVSRELYLEVPVYFPSNSQIPLSHQDSTSQARCPLQCQPAAAMDTRPLSPPEVHQAMIKP